MDPPEIPNYPRATMPKLPFEHESSLPTAEELRTDNVISGIRNPYSGRRRRMYALTALCLGIVAIIGISIGMAGGSDGEASASNGLRDVITDDRTDPNDDLTPREPRVEKVRDFLGKRVSSRGALDEEGTPQNRASLWIADQDPSNVELPEDDADYLRSFGFIQRYILAVIYFSLSGDDWKYNLGFLGGASECDWHFGLSATESVPGSEQSSWQYGVHCNINGEVDTLFMPGCKLIGILPSELGLLLSLNHLSLFDNTLFGPLPENMKYLINLKFLAMESNQLEGNVPSWINEFEHLEYLALGDNLFDGALPSFNRLSNLKEVALDSNQLTGAISVFNEATALESIFLNDNGFEDRVHDALFPDLMSLEVLDLSDNLLTGYFPSHFYNHRIVDLHNNSIGGDLPLVESADFPIEFLSIYDNALTGTIPLSLGFLRQVKHLDVSSNSMTGPLADTFNNMLQLEYLFLGPNNFDEGPIPVMVSLTNLVELVLSGTSRSGNIPDWLGSLSSLKVLDLHNNGLVGQIPESLGDLDELLFLLLNRNDLTGYVPDSFSNLKKLVMIMMDHNRLKGDDSAICENPDGPQHMAYMVGDCDDTFTCECCQVCCPTEDPECNNAALVANLNDSYIRNQYVFSEDLTFDVQSLQPDN